MNKTRPPYQRPEPPSVTGDQRRRTEKFRKVVRDWCRKRKERQEPNRDTRHAIEQVQKAEREALTSELLDEIPQRYWLAGARVRANQARDQLLRFGFPWGKTISFYEFAYRFHDFLRENQHRLAAPDRQGTEEQSLVSMRWERTRILTLQRREMETKLVSRENVRKALNQLARILRGATELLQKYHGADAAGIVEEAVQDFTRNLDRWETSENGNGRAKVQR